MLSSIGFPELIIILAIVVFLFGARRLPEVGNSVGRAIKEFREAMHETKDSSRTISKP